MRPTKYPTLLDWLLASREINEDGCWIWTRDKDKRGYGKGTIDHKTWTIHLLSYEIFHGERTKGLNIMHTCDVNACFNPQHLEEGTPQQNARDKRDRKPPKTQKLTSEQVTAIRKEYALGRVTQRDLADYYGVQQSMISRIIHNIRWEGQK